MVQPAGFPSLRTGAKHGVVTLVTLLVAVAANVSTEEPSAAGVKVTRIDPESA